MKSMLCALAVAVWTLPASAWAQDPFTEVRFHRVHLRNGNVVDGQLLRQTAKEIVLLLRGGEISIRMDQVDHLELVKMKTLNDKPIILETPKVTSVMVGEALKEAPKIRRAPPTTQVKLDAQTEQAVAAALDDYAKADVEMKQTVLNRLSQMGSPVRVYLASLVPTFDREQIPVVLSTLAQSKDAALVPAISALLENADPTLRVHGAMALGALGDISAVPSLGPLVKDKDPSVRAAAVTALAILRSPDAIDVLLPAIMDPDRETRTRALATLYDLANQASRQRELSDAVASALAKSDGDVRLDLITAMGKISNASSWNILSTYLRDDSAAVRQAAATSLAQIAAPDSASAVAAAVEGEKTASVQVALCRAVQKLNILAAGGSLIRWLEEGNQDVKSAALTTLGSLAGQSLGTDPAAWKAWWEKAKPK